MIRNNADVRLVVKPKVLGIKILSGAIRADWKFVVVGCRRIETPAVFGTTFIGHTAINAMGVNQRTVN